MIYNIYPLQSCISYNPLHIYTHSVCKFPASHHLYHTFVSDTPSIFILFTPLIYPIHEYFCFSSLHIHLIFILFTPLIYPINMYFCFASPPSIFNLISPIHIYFLHLISFNIPMLSSREHAPPLQGPKYNRYSILYLPLCTFRTCLNKMCNVRWTSIESDEGIKFTENNQC